jgi:hypothetical protein
MKILIKLISGFIAILLLTPSLSYAQSGWSKKKGEIFAQLTVSTFSSDVFYNIDGKLDQSQKGNSFKQQALNFYSEYGLSDKLDLIVNAPLVRLNSFSNSETAVGMGDFRLGFKYQFIKIVPTSISIEAEISPSNGENIVKNTDTNLDMNLPTSDGEINFWFTLATSGSLPNGKAYASAYSAINKRTEDIPSQIRIGGEVGYLFFDKLWLIGKIHIQETISETNLNSNFLYGGGTEHTSFGLNAFYKLNDNWRITASYFDFGNFFTQQRNQYDGGTYSLGVALEF